jgi:protein TonB
MTSDSLQRGLPPAGDRLMTTLFVAALLHAIVILGVTFSAPLGGDDDGANHGLEVVLVDNQAPGATNPDAAYLAQRSQHGSGNTLESGRTLIPRSAPLAALQSGSSSSEGSGSAQDAGSASGEAARLATTAHSPRIAYFGADAVANAAPEMQVLLSSMPTLGVTPNEDGVELRLRGETRKELWVTADTRASDVAGYLDHWRRKVERIGTLNFPVVARRQRNSGTPVIAVTIDATGKLADAHIRRTSGHRELDDAALRILRLASPFDPFPAEISATHDEIRIAYEWQFIGGEPGGSAVSMEDAADPGEHR